MLTLTKVSLILTKFKQNSRKVLLGFLKGELKKYMLKIKCKTYTSTERTSKLHTEKTGTATHGDLTLNKAMPP